MEIMGPPSKSVLPVSDKLTSEADAIRVEREFATADLALKRGDSALAKKMLDKLLKHHPTHFRSLMLQGAIAIGRLNYAKAEMYVRAALKTLPVESVISLDKAVALTQLVKVLSAQGKHNEAAAFRKILGGADDKCDALVGSKKVGADAMPASETRPQVNAPRALTRNELPSEASKMLKEANIATTQPGAVKRIASSNIKDMAPAPLWNQDELHERKVVYVGMRQRDVLNAFREVRIRLLQKNTSDNIVVLVSSLKAAGGGSFFAFNLAATFALDPKKTALYVDCNPYDSSAERYVNGVINFGLSQYLTDDEITLEQIIYPSGVERVRVIPTAGSNESAAELFNSDRMKTFIQEIKARYPDRFIILDAPSVESSTEARILAQHCDMALLLVPFGRATQDEVLSGIDAVGSKRFAGLVFNH
ncbi:hypothetical protein L1F30_14580 [Simiduia sp. 21SJ11W-1]|uniref:hypothetical protein n=1 Tax=Simiduia sp. 21SJ11W-1 TaxID=2909669 RepID=UPI00209D5001|nr:hypothetical protein [Simiduia sp. 21SJ11W-1]UTA47376.1 hypothetical protein L1F30_14580 [Simiduia sp. 21SJ11W-1]